MHHHRDIGVFEHVAGNPSENTLAQTGMRVSAHDEKIAPEFIGGSQKPCSNNLVDWIEHRAIGCEVMRSEVLLKIRSEWSAPLIIFRPENAYGLRAVQPRQGGHHS